MKNSIKLKYGRELRELIKHPIKLTILVQVAFMSDENTGVAYIDTPKEWERGISDLILAGYLERNDDGGLLLKNKKIIDITLKKQPKRAEIDKQDLMGAELIPTELMEYYNIAVSFRNLFHTNISNINGYLKNIEGAKFGKWVTPIRLMIENDGVTLEQLREVFKFLQDSEFWRGNVQSTQKLREKFNTIYNQLKSDEQRDSKKGTRGANGKSGGQKVSTEYAQRVFNDLCS